MKNEKCNKKLLLHGKYIMFFLIGAIILAACSHKNQSIAPTLIGKNWENSNLDNIRFDSTSLYMPVMGSFISEFSYHFSGDSLIISNKSLNTYNIVDYDNPVSHLRVKYFSKDSMQLIPLNAGANELFREFENLTFYNSETVDRYSYYIEKDIDCLSEINRAKRMIANDSVVVHVYYHYGFRQEKEFVELLEKQGFLYKNMGPAPNRLPIPRDCFREAMDYYINKKHGPNFVDSLMKLADTLLLSQFSEADKWVELGKEAFENSDYTRAETCYQKALEADSNYLDAYYNLGLIYGRHDIDKAIEYHSKAIADNDTIEHTYFSLGSFYLDKDDFGKALEMYKKGLKQEQNVSPNVHYFMGLLYAHNNKYVYSRAHITKAAQLGDSSAQAFFGGDSRLWKDTLMRPDYNRIKLNVENKQSNLYYPKLWDRFQKGDSAMTKEEMHHLYYGYVFDEGYSPFLSVHNPKQMKDILRKENPTKEEWAEFASSLNESLKAEPLNCLYLYYQSLAYDALNKPDKSKINFQKIRCLLHAQAYSGDGLLKETAIHLIAGPATPHDFDYLFFNGLSLRDFSIEEKIYNVLYPEPNEDELEEIWVDLSQAFKFIEQFRK